MRRLAAALLTLAAPFALAAQPSAPSADAVTHAQPAKPDSTNRKYFIGSTLFMLANAVPDNNPPQMVYLNVGYRVTRKDIVSLEFKTWKYGWPIGIPYGKSFEAESEAFPGAKNPFPWMSEIMDLRKEKNFFETRVIEYQTGGALSWE